MTPTCHVPSSFSQGDLAAIARVPLARLRRWQRMGLLPRRREYAWRDLALAQKLRRCAADPRAFRRLRSAVRRAGAEAMPGLLENGFLVIGTRLAVPAEGGMIDVATGQYELPLHPPEPAVVEARGERGAADATAEQWFAFALSLEGNAALRLQAAESYERCLQLDPNFVSAYINLGTVRYHLKDYEEAERCYREALRLDAGYALAWFDLGNVLDETGRLEEAIAAYAAAVRLAPGYADAHYNLALAYQRSGRQRRAVPHWRQYLESDRTSPWAAHARSQLKRSLADDVLQLVPRRA